MNAGSIRRLLKWRVRLAELTRPGEIQSSLFWAGVVGLLGGLAGVAFRELLDLAHALFTGHEGDVVDTAIVLPPWMRLLVPTLGGLGAGLILHYGMRLSRRKSTTDFMEAVAVGDGAIGVRSSVVKSSSSLVTLASGGSIGREGVMVQLAALLASLTGRGMRFSTPRLRLLVACGAAAGIASAYKAPIAGALFVGEIVLGSIAMQSFGPLIFASVVATVVTRSFVGLDPLFDVPRFQMVSSVELGAHLLLGIVTGIAAPVFLNLLRASEVLFSYVRPPFLRLALGGLVVGALSLQRPEVWGNGYSVVDSMLRTDWMWQMLLVVLLFKVVATAATAGSGAVGGVFTPTLFVGAVVGSLFGELLQQAWPGAVAPPHAYALVGMGCLLAGTTHAPLMAILMIFEMSLSYEIVLPLMIACVTATLVSTRLEPRSIYSESLQRKAPPAPVAADVRVRDLMHADALVLRSTAPFAEVAECFARNRRNYLYVVDAQERLAGGISLHDIKEHLNDADVGHVVIASDLMRADLPVLTPESTLLEALDSFSRYEGERVPVVASAGDRRLVGSLAKNDVMLTLAHGVEPARPRS